MKTIKQNLSIAALLCWATAGLAATTNTLHPGDDIQAAVNTATSGDLILLSAGTSAPTNEISVTNAITIRGIDGAEATIIDGGGSHRCFNLGSAACILSGLTLQNGKPT